MHDLGHRRTAAPRFHWAIRRRVTPGAAAPHTVTISQGARAQSFHSAKVTSGVHFNTGLFSARGTFWCDRLGGELQTHHVLLAPLPRTSVDKVGRVGRARCSSPRDIDELQVRQSDAWRSF